MSKMQKIKSQKQKKLTYIDKTRIISRDGSDIFCRNFFNINDASMIIDEVFEEKLVVQIDYFLALLNNSISFVGNLSIDLTELTPGKADERQLMRRIFGLVTELKEHLHVLLNQYCLDVNKFIPIFIDWPDASQHNFEKVDSYDFLHKLKRECEYLERVKDVVFGNLEQKPGKKTGNNTNNPSYQYIYQLINVYKIVTGKEAKDNFHQEHYSVAPFVGEFYNFVYCIFKIIKDNFTMRYPNITKINPFEINLEEKSYALGSLIRNVLSFNQ